MKGVQDSITIYPPTATGKSFVIYTKSEMVSTFKALNLKVGDRIAVSFSNADVDETIGMFNALLEQKVVVRAIVDLPLQRYTDGKLTEYKIKTVDAFTDSASEDDDDENKERPCKRKK